MSYIPSQVLYTYFAKEFNLKKTSGNWYSFKCPICNELENRKKMAVHFTYGVVKCWICSYKDFALEFICEYEGFTVREAREKLRGIKPSEVDFSNLEESAVNLKTFDAIKLPYGFKSLREGETSMAVRARRTLKDRGFNIKELDNMGFGYCDLPMSGEMEDDEDFFGYIIIPVKAAGKLVYYLGRDFVGNYLRYKNPPKSVGVGKGEILFNEDALRIYAEVFVLEGWSDAATIGRQATATLGSEWSAIQKRKILDSQCDRIVIVPDAGTNGSGKRFYVKALEHAMEIVEHKEVVVVDMDGLESGKDVNEIGREVFMELYRNSPVLTPELIIKEMFDA